MTELVLVFCLAAHPDFCREVRESMEPQACALREAQTQAIAWLGEHPLWRFSGTWRCEDPQQRQLPT